MGFDIWKIHVTKKFKIPLILDSNEKKGALKKFRKKNHLYIMTCLQKCLILV